MYCTRNVSDSVVWVGASDRRLALFENLFPIPRGVSYNSYLILDEKTALLDTTDASVTRQYLENVSHSLNGKPLDYLIINHMEPDHCANIAELLLRYPHLTLVGNAKTFAFVSQFYDLDLTGRTLTVKEGDTLCLGSHTLHFFLAPMVHWPEVMVTYEETEQILFSADAFGSFGALNGHLFADEVNFDRDWLDDARRYYCNIVGKYGIQVQAALKKLSALSIRTICPLHGPVLTGNLGYYLGLYDTWSSYAAETEGVLVAYASVYGNTKKAAETLAEKLRGLGCPAVKLVDLARDDMAEAVADAFRYTKIVLASPTYNGDVFPFMRTFVEHLTERNLRRRTVGVIENGSWAPVAAKTMKQMLENSKEITFAQPTVTVRSAMNAENEAQLSALAEALAK